MSMPLTTPLMSLIDRIPDIAVGVDDEDYTLTVASW